MNKIDKVISLLRELNKTLVRIDKRLGIIQGEMMKNEQRDRGKGITGGKLP